MNFWENDENESIFKVITIKYQNSPLITRKCSQVVELTGLQSSKCRLCWREYNQNLQDHSNKLMSGANVVGNQSNVFALRDTT